MGLRRIAGVAAVIGTGYLVCQWLKDKEDVPAPEGTGWRPPSGPTSSPPPTPPSRTTPAVADLGPPSPDQVPAYKLRFNAALEDGRFDDAAGVIGLLREAGEETWADNADRMIEERRRRS